MKCIYNEIYIVGAGNVNDIPLATSSRLFENAFTTGKQSLGVEITQNGNVAQVNIGKSRKCLVQLAS